MAMSSSIDPENNLIASFFLTEKVLQKYCFKASYPWGKRSTTLAKSTVSDKKLLTEKKSS